MTTMRHAAEDYVALRRAMGFKLEKPGQLVLQFTDHLDRLGARQLTIDAALAWARQPANADPSWWAYRLSAVRGFAAYLHPRLPGTQVPPPDLLPLRTRRATPYLYSVHPCRGRLPLASASR
jgi:integrase/recombinase XerD